MSTPSEPRTIVRASGLSRQVELGAETLTLLSGLDLDVEAGDTLAIVGRSGSGKSTLLALLAGLDSPTAGDVWLAGASLAGLSEDGRARLRQRAVGFVFQNFQLLPALTALENVMLPLELAGRRDARERAAAL
ncbi:MAG: ATP-binding cassette domain-containing protein, partial [Microvirgula sp.]